MKKLLIILILGLLSLNSMAMGFPHSTVSQQRALLSKPQKINITQNLQQVEAKLVDKVDEEKSSFVQSLMEKVSNFIVKVFTEMFSSNKSVAAKSIKIKPLPIYSTPQEAEKLAIG